MLSGLILLVNCSFDSNSIDLYISSAKLCFSFVCEDTSETIINMMSVKHNKYFYNTHGKLYLLCNRQ